MRVNLDLVLLSNRPGLPNTEIQSKIEKYSTWSCPRDKPCSRRTWTHRSADYIVYDTLQTCILNKERVLILSLNFVAKICAKNPFKHSRSQWPWPLTIYLKFALSVTPDNDVMWATCPLTLNVVWFSVSELTVCTARTDGQTACNV